MPKAVAAFLVAGLVVLTAVGLVLALALHLTATTRPSVRPPLVTELEAISVVGQALSDEAVVPGPAYDKPDEVARQHVIENQSVRFKVWEATGRIVYSDDKSLVGLWFPLGAEDPAVLTSGGALAEVTNLKPPRTRASGVRQASSGAHCWSFRVSPILINDAP